AGLEPEHRLLLAYSVVGMVEGASRLWLGRDVPPITTGDNGEGISGISSEASLLASRVADLAWAGLRQVHRD
ncbi:MAG TPA: hypothetical protein VG205_07355, partial [Acidimicrobiales bacterium]|nr:hypothetical protein [Acidimicrobiales bacterium]